MHDIEGPLAQPADRKDSLAAIRAAIHGKAARRREAVDVNELVSDFGFMYMPLYFLLFLQSNDKQVRQCHNA